MKKAIYVLIQWSNYY